jgi:hypothetical protein
MATADVLHGVQNERQCDCKMKDEPPEDENGIVQITDEQLVGVMHGTEKCTDMVDVLM